MKDETNQGEIFRTTRAGFPPAQGLYDPMFEKDACGVGFICDMNGRKSHTIIRQALQILENLTHRGAVGDDEKTGDGAGIKIQFPDALFQEVACGLGIRLPAAGEYASGLVFLPIDSSSRRVCMTLFEKTIVGEGQRFLGWREVPVDDTGLGDTARKQRPVIFQVFIGRGKGITSQQHFERKLYVIRKLVAEAVRRSGMKEAVAFYVPSLSSKTFVYKGMLLAAQISEFFLDLCNPAMVSGLALVHQRYSTNTFPTWSLAQPFRFISHNGEINTLRGNENWFNAREEMLASHSFGEDLAKVFPVLSPGGSDSAKLDNTVELLYHAGRSLPHVIMMLIPEAWQHHRTMSPEKRAFYEYHACLMEPWDGPASIAFTDGECIGAVLDRNGLRPSRYSVTKDGLVIMSSETGVLDIEPENILRKGRLEPGRMLLVDINEGRIVEDEEIKAQISTRQPYGRWLKENLVRFSDLPSPKHMPKANPDAIEQKQQLFGYTQEDLNLILAPMADAGKEPIGSMGDDAPLAVLSARPRLLYDYLKQLFAQVTNPPLDAIREALVTSLFSYIGAEQNILQESPAHCHMFKLEQPVLSNEELVQIREMIVGDIRAVTLQMTYNVSGGGDGILQAMDSLCRSASMSVARGIAIIILSDRGCARGDAPIPAALAVAGLHHHLIRTRQRTKCAIVVESGEPREVHHFCVLLGCGASGINPYLAYATIANMLEQGYIESASEAEALANYRNAAAQGILKVMSKMGISTLQSYQGAQIFEAIGLGPDIVNRFFTGMPSRIGGATIHTIAEQVSRRHDLAFPKRITPGQRMLDPGGIYQWRHRGEKHLYNPLSIAHLQSAVRSNNPKTYLEYSALANKQSREYGTIRGLLEFRTAPKTAIPLEEVEPWTEIVKRFKTGAMSYGSISKEAHETLAIAMNRIGGKSNSGEGGEDADRYINDPNGDSRRSAIKQVASGRFGVTSHYLVNADEIQIKIAQGAKPGEGGQLPGFKVYPWIAKTRHSTPYVGLISPPPHHDIYSIEDLAQLIFDLKNVNEHARVNVKLVSEVGVGTVAAGVAKGKADVILISGSDGGTGATPLTSVKHTGMPWEIGLAEVQQTLLLNNLRNRIVIECDGQLKTGRDVAIACLLGAEEFGFATAPLVAAGCIMMRVCHLNTCPVGIATQDPELRRQFDGKPEHLINYFHFVAEELRGIMASLGFRTMTEMIGRVDKLESIAGGQDHNGASIDLSALLHQPGISGPDALYCSIGQVHELSSVLDKTLIRKAAPALEEGEAVIIETRISNTDRSVGAMLSSEISRRFGEDGLPDDTIQIHCNGSAGQSFGAFGAHGITIRVEGDANDYLGKGLSGSKLIITPPRTSTFVAEENVLVGNVAFYGATRGESYIRGRAGERFCVRNSGVTAVVEGVGDHGCEYMTGGRAVILGETGRNFAAGMSGGIAYVLDISGQFRQIRCNMEMVELEELDCPADLTELHSLIGRHFQYTGSAVAKRILHNWAAVQSQFVKVMPVDYKRALQNEAESKTAFISDNFQPLTIEKRKRA